MLEKLDFAAILAILAVDLWLAIDQRANRKLFEDFFRSRTRYYEARRRGPEWVQPSEISLLEEIRREADASGEATPAAASGESSLDSPDRRTRPPDAR